MLSRTLAVAALLLGLHAGGAAAQQADPAAPRPGAAQVALADLEARLLAATALDLRFKVHADGAFTASLEGTLRLEGSQVELEAGGTFGDAAAALSLVADGTVMQGGNSGRQFRQTQPGALLDALLIGWTRMGVLHNLARLTGALAPDHASGGVREWVEARNIRAALPAQPGRTGIQFEVHVDGTHAGDATFWLDAVTGLPVERLQVVRFPGGEMRVREEYEVTGIVGPKPAGR